MFRRVLFLVLVRIFGKFFFFFTYSFLTLEVLAMASLCSSALLWCCAGCIRGSDDCTEYYTLLGLDPSCTPAEVRQQTL